MIFKFNNLTYDVPEGVGISIEVTAEREEIDGEVHSHLDFNFVKDGEHIPMLGGVDERGQRVKRWNDYGIQRVIGGLSKKEKIMSSEEDAERGPVARGERTFVVSAKDTAGEWKTLRVVEVRITQPVVVYSDTAGTLMISGARGGGAD